MARLPSPSRSSMHEEKRDGRLAEQSSMHAVWNLSTPMIWGFAVITIPDMCKRKTAEVVASEMLKDDRVSKRCEIRTVGDYSPGRGTARRSVFRMSNEDSRTDHAVT